MKENRLAPAGNAPAQTSYQSARFSPGRLVITPTACDMLCELGLSERPFLKRHLSADWGTMSQSDKEANDSALASGDDRIFSSYSLPNGKKLWIITEWDRSATTILLPEDY